MVTNAFGADPDDLAAASPIDVVRTVGGPVPDTVIVTRGLPRRRAQAQTFASAMRDAGGSVTVVTANGYSHREVNHQLGAAGETVETPAVTELLGRCLA
jgi:acetyl esterase/lipase